MINELRLWSLIERRASETPQALFAIDERDRRLHFIEFRDACLRCAAGLAELGVGRDTRVSWQLPTWLESMILVGALSRLGAIQNPLLPFLREREVGFITRQTRARFLFVPSTFRGFDHQAMANQLAEGSPELRVIVVDRELPDAEPSALPEPVDQGSAEPPTRWIFYSSGTTGDPKGAQHSDVSVGSPGQAMAHVLILQPEDRSALVFPFTHVGGINWLFAGLISGCSHIVVEAFDPKGTLEVLAKNGVTVAGSGTVFHQAYLAAQREQPQTPLFPEARVFPGGGAPKPPGLHAEVKAELGGAGVVAGYGLTEHPIAVMGTVEDPDDKLATTEGRATPGTELRIVGTGGELRGAGEEGEIRVRGPHLFRGYVDSALNEGAFDENGFLRTGDLGKLDEGGWLTVTGRLKDIIIRKGENISAKEVEDHLFEHPDVGDVAVVGLPDEASGERACAFVVATDPARTPSFESICAFLDMRALARQKHPEQLEFLELLPRNASGKVLKNELRQRFSEVPS